MNKVNYSVNRGTFEERRTAVKRLRKKCGLAQCKLAALAGVALKTLNRFEVGVQDMTPRAHAKIEQALSDALAGQRLSDLLRSQRTQVSPLAQLCPPPPGTKDYWRGREDFFQHDEGTMTPLTIDSSRLADQNVQLLKQITELKRVVEILQQQAHNWEEASVLQSEVIRQLEELVPNKPREAEEMLARARLSGRQGVLNA
jgi:DNA-binding XRE family transcriptional regulator